MFRKNKINGGRVNPSAPKKKRSRRWFDWHSWLGTISGLLLFIIFWSGSFAVLSHEIDWLINPMLRVTPTSDAADLAQIHGRCCNGESNIQNNNCTKKPLPPILQQEVHGETPDGERRRIYVDPYTHEITGSTSWLNIQRFFRDFHRRFYDFPYGHYLVCFLALPLIMSLITGLFFYKRWWKRFFEIKLNKGSKVLWSSIHKTLGLWSFWFVLVIGTTGLWYLFEAARSDYIDEKFSYVGPGETAVNPMPTLKDDGTSLSFRELMDKAGKARPDMNITMVYLDREGYFYFEGHEKDLLVRTRANKVYIDPSSGQIAYSQTASDLSVYWYWSDMADPLHFGTFAGLASKIIWFIFGLLLSGLSLTGAWLHLKRLQKDKKNRAYWRGSVTVGFASIMLFFFSMQNQLSEFISHWHCRNARHPE